MEKLLLSVIECTCS